ncbi:MAG: ATP-dependent RNA helicase HrpA [Phycisphaeraceae bacterium]|nr:ATP-dependent RNA helicase HrpA [Phycisphaeraceae bacterium]
MTQPPAIICPVETQVDQIGQWLPQAMRRDRPRLARMLQSARQSLASGHPCDRNLTRLARAMDQSVERRHRRSQATFALDYPPDLPIAEHRRRIIDAIRSNQVVVVAGETGSGKSTQLPKCLLEAGYGHEGFIGHTQPRRIAARALASRLAQELRAPELVGYKVRFTDATSPDTMVKFMTDGVLLAETQTDRMLLGYDAIILDEAHERSLNIDFLLGYLRQLLPRRPELRLVITSATIDVDRFAAHFPGPDGKPSPIIEVSGRSWPVDILYRPMDTDEDHDAGDNAQDSAFERAVVDVVREAAAMDRGDMLVFLPTERAIASVTKALRRTPLPGDSSAQATQVLPLYARLPTSQQQAIFNPGPARRVILATNVAESSLTVPRIRFVIDTGTARISRYSSRSRMQRLPIEAVAQASSRQRAGRCGRIGPGICFRLYSETDFNGRDAFTTPEILRTSLASVILQMKSLRLGAVEEFPFLEPPRTRMIQEGYRTLREIQAVDEQHELTPIGRTLAKLPVDPRLGRVIFAADKENCLSEVLIIASALECQDPRLRPPEQEQAADAAHQRYRTPDSDFLAFLKLWDFYHHLKQTLSHSKLRKACQQNFLSYTRCREWTEVYRQLADLAEESGLKRHPRKDQSLPIHRAMLTGLLSNIAMRGQRHAYRGTDEGELFLWPGSVLFTEKPAWIVAAEIVQTERTYARVAAKIDPGLIEPLALHLVKRSHGEPRWDRRPGQVVAWEKVSLLGLPIVPRRRIGLGRVDPVKAREMFIWHALVEEDCDCDAPFFQQNQRLRKQLTQLIARRRDRKLTLDEQRMFAFYDRKLPEKVYSLASLDHWRRRAEHRQPKLLWMRQSDLLPELDDPRWDSQAFPKMLEMSGLSLPLSYEFDAASPRDGVTVKVPAEGLGSLNTQRLAWLVPGRLEELLTAILRALPMPWRGLFVPAPHSARRILPRLRFGEGDLAQQMAQELGREVGQIIPPAVIDLEALEPHLRMNIQALGAGGKVIAEGRDLGELKSQVSRKITDALTLPRSPWHRDGLTNWDWDELPEQVELPPRMGMNLVSHPAIIDQGDRVGLRLLPSPEDAVQQSWRGVRRLVTIQIGQTISSHLRHVQAGMNALRLHWQALSQSRTLEQEMMELIVARGLADAKELPRRKDAFEALADQAWNRINTSSKEVVTVLSALLERASSVCAALEQPAPAAWRASLADLRDQAKRLLPDGFLLQTPWPQITHLPRYVEAMRVRLHKLSEGGVVKDQQWLTRIQPRWNACFAAPQAKQPQRFPQWRTYRWLLEEWRVSLFAQHLGTAAKASDKRLEEQWEKVCNEARA